MTDTKVTLSGVTLDNPVIAASGTFGFGYEYARFYDINILGSISIKGTTGEPRFGNPTPRIAETPSGMLNSVGLQNPGIDEVIAKELPWLAECFSKPIIANIGGFSEREFAESCEKISALPQVAIIELNISCPNIHSCGVNFSSSAETAAAATKAAKAVTKKPLYVKLSPNVTDITEIAAACEQAGADGISLINTLMGMRVDIKTRRPVLANRVGGLSGPAIFPVALRMVHDVSRRVKIPVIGIGGITTAADVIEMMMAGATAVQVGAANLVNPYACKEIIESLPAKMSELKITSLTEIIGAAHPPL